MQVTGTLSQRKTVWAQSGAERVEPTGARPPSGRPRLSVGLRPWRAERLLHPEVLPGVRQPSARADTPTPASLWELRGTPTGT